MFIEKLQVIPTLCFVLELHKRYRFVFFMRSFMHQGSPFYILAQKGLSALQVMTILYGTVMWCHRHKHSLSLDVRSNKECESKRLAHVGIFCVQLSFKILPIGPNFLLIMNLRCQKGISSSIIELADFESSSHLCKS